LINIARINYSSESLEAIRITLNRNLSKSIKNRQFHLKIRLHPTHILRNNKMLTKAGADRVQTGMRKSFGKPEGLCARTKANQKILSVRGRFKFKIQIVNAIRQITYKLPGRQEIRHSQFWGFTKLKIVDFVNKSMENELSKYGDSAKINHTPRSKILFSS